MISRPRQGPAGSKPETDSRNTWDAAANNHNNQHTMTTEHLADMGPPRTGLLPAPPQPSTFSPPMMMIPPPIYGSRPPRLPSLLPPAIAIPHHHSPPWTTGGVASAAPAAAYFPATSLGPILPATPGFTPAPPVHHLLTNNHSAARLLGHPVASVADPRMLSGAPLHQSQFLSAQGLVPFQPSSSSSRVPIASLPPAVSTHVHHRRDSQGASSADDDDLSRQGDEDGLTSQPPRKRKRMSKKEKKRRGLLSDSADGEREFNGEERLAIQFDSYGVIDPALQVKLGANKGFIPDGLSGSFNMYAERWAFEVHFGGKEACKDGKTRVCVEWCIRSQPHWKDFHRVKETVDEAQTRETRGFTLCNRVFREAMQRRAEEYEQLAREEEQHANPNPLQIANYQRQASFLKPEKVSEGPLLFGLRHKVVQDHIKQQQLSYPTKAKVQDGKTSSNEPGAPSV